MMTPTKYPPIKPQIRLHTCSVCGRCGEWTDAWAWWGSWLDEDNGASVLKFCSDRCRKKAREGEG